MSAAFTLSRLLVLLLLAFGLTAADKKPETPLPPPSLEGYVFAVDYLTEKGKHLPKDKLTFGADSMQLASLGELKFTLTVVRKGKKAKEFDFSGTATDAKGTVIEISGKVEIEGDDMHGSVTRRPKDEDAVAVNFGGKIATAPKPLKK